VKRRTRTIALGAIPLLMLTSLVSMDRIPGTDIDLTVPYAAEGPGPLFDTLSEYDGKDVIEITGADLDETEGSLNMTTVSVRSGMTLTQALGRWLFTDDTLVPLEQVFPQDKTEEEVREMNQQAFTSSEASATTAAMNYLKLPVGTEVAGIVEESAADGILEIGDRVLQVDASDRITPSQVQASVQDKNPGDEITLKIRTKDGKVRDQSFTLGENPHQKGLPQLGILMAAVPANGMEVKYNLEDVGGPSAGMMFALAVIDKLDEDNISQGKNVAGTGTIDEAGNVGPIGGITHKVRASKDAGAEVFLAPSANCSELTDVDDIPIIAVTNLEGAITSLDDFANGREYPRCNG
jgi:PDZ domain-containing protein